VITVEFGTVGLYQVMAEMLNSNPVWAQKSAQLDHTMAYRYGPAARNDGVDPGRRGVDEGREV